MARLDDSKSNYQTRIVRSIPEWKSLRKGWSKLLRETPGSGALQSIDFLLCWWRHFGTYLSLCIPIVYLDGELVGVAPLQIRRHRLFGIKIRALEFIGMPDDLARPMFLAKNDDVEILQRLFDAIAGLRHDWDMLILEEVVTRSSQVSKLQQWADETSLHHRILEFKPSPYLVKATDWSGFLSSRSKRFPKRLRSSQKKLAAVGPVRYVSAGIEADAAQLVDEFFSVESRSWKADSGHDVGEDERYRAFYRDLVSSVDSEIKAHAIVMYVDNIAAAATFGISLDSCYYALQIAHDKGFDRYSPGTLLEAEEMRQFFNNECLTRYEFMTGTVLNKRRWADRAIHTSIQYVYGHELRAMLVGALKCGIEPAIRRTYQILRPPKSARVRQFELD